MRRTFLAILFFVISFIVFSFGNLFSSNAVSTSPVTTVAVDDFYVIDQAQYLPIVLNDVEIIGSPITVDGPLHGFATEYGDGTQYAPFPGYTGFDSYTYHYRTHINPDEF